MSLNLFDLVKSNKFKGMKLSVIKKFAQSIARALSFVHRKRIIHGDLKPENVLLQQYGRTGVKVIDFGSSVYTDGKLLTYVQSRFYRAPEVILGLHYDTRWTCGASGVCWPSWCRVSLSSRVVTRRTSWTVLWSCWALLLPLS